MIPMNMWSQTAQAYNHKMRIARIKIRVDGQGRVLVGTVLLRTGNKIWLQCFPDPSAYWNTNLIISPLQQFMSPGKYLRNGVNTGWQVWKIS